MDTCMLFGESLFVERAILAEGLARRCVSITDKSFALGFAMIKYRVLAMRVGKFVASN